MATDAGKHVMLSYNHKSKSVVQAVYAGLLAENIPVWFDERDMHDDMYDRMAEAVHKASIVCCFLTPEYENSKNCQRELQSATHQEKRIIPCMVSNRKVWKPSPEKWLHFITNSIIAIDFSDTSEATIQAKTNELINLIRGQPTAPSKPPIDPFEPIRSKYLKENQIKRIINEERSFPIEKSYINLAIVENKAQKDKEKKLEEESHGKKEAILGTFEEIYGIKTSIDVANMFEKCKQRTRKVFILGRAGIGKSTFCQYVTYRWANGEIWSEYDLVVLIHLRKLTKDRYPPKNKYSPADLIEKEYFPIDDLSNEGKKYFKEQCKKDKVLWILDGYDEFAQNIPEHLQDVFDYVRNTQHHILTSRPYAISLPYDVKMEIVGFTDDNIVNYVEQFFDQISTEIPNASLEGEKLLRFLRSNPSIWGIGHIPVNLELICSLWSNTDSSKTTMLTMTRLYDNLIEWLCRRYLARQDKKHETITKQAVYKLCKTELQFFEHLAFRAMENNEILLSPALLEETENEIHQTLADYPQLLNIGILKSYDSQPTGNRVETNKQHYFVHLSFQEHFAARHLLRTLQSPNNKQAVDFINNNKYNQRFSLVFTFASGLLTQPDYKSVTRLFWATIQGEPSDLVGIRHIKLIIECIDESLSLTLSPDSSTYLRDIALWIGICARQNQFTITRHLSQSLQRTTSLANTSLVQETFRLLLETEDPILQLNISRLISEISITNVTPKLISALNATLRDADTIVQHTTCQALIRIGETAALCDVITALLGAICDENDSVRQYACQALEAIGEKAATSDVIAALLGGMGDESASVRFYVCKALGAIGEKAATSEVIVALLGAMGDENEDVRRNACDALGTIGEKAATSDVIAALLGAMGDENDMVRFSACEALGAIGEKAATSEVIAALLGVMGNESASVRSYVCKALGAMGEKAATSEVIVALLGAMGDENGVVRFSAFEALGVIGEKAATSDVIATLLDAIRGENEYVRQCAFEALGVIGEKAATSEVIATLLDAIRGENKYVRQCACIALGAIGEKAATSEAIAAMLDATHDEDGNVRQYACQALGRIGEKAATSGAIAALLGATHDEDGNVRQYACVALGAIGGKAATSEVIAALLGAMGDENGMVRSSAFEALGAIGEKAATSEVIAALLNAIRNENEYVRQCACIALGAIGEKAAPCDVITALLGAIYDENDSVRQYACQAFGRIGEKAAMSEAIAALLGAMDDENGRIRFSACEALGAIGEKAATSEVIAALLDALGDENIYVRRNACQALGAIGDKAATSEVIVALVAAVGDENEYVRRNACEALGAIGEKAATSEVIAALLDAMGDENIYVRRNACQALGAIGEKAATSEVIAALVAAVGDENEYVRQNACNALGAIGEKAATSEVISTMIKVLPKNTLLWDSGTASALERAMCSDDGMKGLRLEIISQLASYVRETEGFEGTAWPPDHLTKIYLETRNATWLPLVVHVAMLQGVAMVAVGDAIQIYSSNGVVEVPVFDSMLYENFVEAFRNQRRQLERDSGAGDGD